MNLILFSKKCVLCGLKDPNTNKYALCNSCHEKIIHSLITPKKRCNKCGLLLLVEDGLCLSCRSRSYSFTKNYSLFMYRSEIAELVKLYKFNKEYDLYKLWTALFVLEKNLWFKNIPIVPMAIRANRKKNECDTVKLITKSLSKKCNLHFLPCLKRIGNKQQKKLSYTQRVQNIENKIFVKKKYLKQAAPKSLFLLDDIFTTGSTLSSAAKALNNWGVETVLGLTLAHD